MGFWPLLGEVIALQSHYPKLKLVYSAGLLVEPRSGV